MIVPISLSVDTRPLQLQPNIGSAAKMTISRATDKRKVAENVGKIAGPTHGFWHPYALEDPEKRIGPRFLGMREFQVTVCR